MTVNLSFTIPDPVQLLVYVVIAIVATALLGGLARMRSGLGYFFTLLVSGFGAWLFANLLQIQVLNDVRVGGVPLIQALLGALLLGALSVLVFRRRNDVVVYED